VTRGVLNSIEHEESKGVIILHKFTSDVARVDDSTLVHERSEFSLTSAPTCARNEVSWRSPLGVIERRTETQKKLVANRDPTALRALGN